MSYISISKIYELNIDCLIIIIGLSSYTVTTTHLLKDLNKISGSGKTISVNQRGWICRFRAGKSILMKPSQYSCWETSICYCNLTSFLSSSLWLSRPGSPMLVSDLAAIPDGLLVIIDEAQRCISPRSSTSDAPAYVAWLSTHRPQELQYLADYVAHQAHRCLCPGILVGKHQH